MKKSVLLILIFLSVAVFFWTSQYSTVITGLDVLDLPAPPSPPGIAQPNQVSDTYDSEVIVVPNVPAQQPQVQYPIPTQVSVSPTAASQLESSLQGVESRVASLESKVDQLSVQVQNAQQLSQKPLVDRPTFTAEIDKVKRNAIINFALLTVFVCLMIVLVVGFFVNKHMAMKREHEEEKETIAEYIRNYTKQGYDMKTLKEHLRASGWSDDLIDEAAKDMWV